MNEISTHFINFKTDIADQRGRVLGPNMFNEYFAVVEQERENGITRLGLAISHHG